MASEQHDFDVVRRLDPDAVGVPGRRRFRLVVENDDETAFLWIEKEQLQALGLAVDQMLTPIKEVWSANQKDPEPAPPKVEAGHASVEFQVGRLGLGYDENTKQFVIVAHDVDSDADAPPNFTCRVPRALLSHLSESIAAITAAGRARCPLCGTPVTEGEAHFCPGSNGHARHE
jgi:uncharacterized repeat protein (TIGR03847 family)